MPDGALPRGVKRRVRGRDDVAVGQGQPVGEPRRAGKHTAHRIPVEFVHQIGEARAFGVHGRAVCRQRGDLLPNTVVGGQFGAELFGEPAGQHQCRGVRRQLLGQRVELDDIGPCRPE